MPIRPATAADLPALLALDRTAETAAHWSPRQYQAIFDTEPRRVALVAEENCVVQGFLVARVLEREFELENIAVSPSRRRRGVGRDLINHLHALSRREQAKAIHLEVRESNVPARALYEKCSFRRAGRRAHYYENPQEDAIIYRLALH